MILPFIAFSLFVFLFLDGFSPKKEQPKKTPEQELGDAIAKYLSNVGEKPKP
ncbi:MAG TPA: hypothetical protein V6C95_18405 [Coleofasciculaceae cyanobacterium]